MTDEEAQVLLSEILDQSYFKDGERVLAPGAVRELAKIFQAEKNLDSTLVQAKRSPIQVVLFCIIERIYKRQWKTSLLLREAI